MTQNAATRDSILLESGTNEVEFIEFFLGGISHGINVSKVQRVMARSSVKVTGVAQAPYGTIGMIHIQDEPIMLMDLKSVLGIPFDPESLNLDRQLILVTSFNKQTTAFLIDGISKIHRTSWEFFEPLSQSATGYNGNSYSTGTVTIDENIIVILDLEQLMLSLFPSTHGAYTTEDLVECKEERTAIRILYAEDSKMVRTITEDILKQSGYIQIESFSNGEEAYSHLLKRISEGGPPSPYDLVLTDIEMPQMDGLTLCKRVKSEACPDSPPKVIVYSSLINKEMSLKCASVGADAQLAKPDVAQIVELIDSLCLPTSLN
ncbi:chemotaxis protein [Pelagicoccus albus]|uniref:Chemotaxis protein CheV n=1 Tax=Pelagicoccus albus TaxID=415222 RepID=A0A7X1E942_9BACT|nr:chemotaxis protein [Pelagicoccus albus]MBC2606813.1 chemotaxis protein CheV [Pelagicoccus albus]